MPISRQSRPHYGSTIQWHTRSGSRVGGAGRDFIGVARSGARSVQRAGPFARPRQASLHASLLTHLSSPRSAAIQEPQRETPRPDVVVACSPPSHGSWPWFLHWRAFSRSPPPPFHTWAVQHSRAARSHGCGSSDRLALLLGYVKPLFAACCCQPLPAMALGDWPGVLKAFQARSLAGVGAADTEPYQTACLPVQAQQMQANLLSSSPLLSSPLSSPRLASPRQS